MDIPAHIIDAVHNQPPTASDHMNPNHVHMEQSKSPRQLSPNGAYPRYKEFKDFHDSADDGSTGSISEPDHGYTTEPTTPSTSASCVVEDMTTDEVEDFKDREYPQLKGKTYLDHGGTTVRGPMQGVRMRSGIWY
jgi:molybdenum cofactor sulfurtransferase